MKKWISNIDWLTAILMVLALRSLHSMEIAQSVVFVAFSVYLGYKKWLDMQSKPDVSEEVMKELEKIKNVVSGLAVKNAAKNSIEGKRFF
jgi:hypothetical protein